MVRQAHHERKSELTTNAKKAAANGQQTSWQRKIEKPGQAEQVYTTGK